MKTLTTLKVQAIFSYENAEQDFTNAEVIVPAVPLDIAAKTELEADVLEQILKQAADNEDVGGAFDELVKISLCYNSAQLGVVERGLLAFLIRNGAKYYFQPNQRSYVEDELMQRIPGLASKTKAFA
jgi:hypothetical protein